MTALKLPAITRSMVIVYPTGRVTPAFQRFWQNLSLSADTTASELPGIKAQVATNATAVTSLNGAVSSLTTTVTANYNTLQAQVTTNATAVAGLSGSVASLNSTVSANYSSLQGQINTTASAVAGLNGVYGRYGVIVSGGDQFAGFEVMAGVNAGTTVNYFKIAASEFRIQPPTGSQVQPFVYDAINGWLTVQNVRVRGDLIVDGTIVGNAIAPAAITTPAISPGAVTNPKIERDTVTNGIAANSAPSTVLNASGMADIHSYSHTLIGGRARMFWQIEVINFNPSLPGDMELEVTVNGAPQRYYSANVRAAYTEHHSFSVNAYGAPGSPVTMTLRGKTSTGGGGAANLTAAQVWLDVDDFGTEA